MQGRWLFKGFMLLTYIIIAVLLLAAELLYFRIADHFNIIDRPNERSSHSTIVLRGGGVIFALSMIVWAVMMVARGQDVVPYLPFLCGLMIVCCVSFWDDVRSLPDSVRLVAQFIAMALMFWSMGIMHWSMWLFVMLALIGCVGATNVINFMDGINGITGGYAMAVLLPLYLVNRSAHFIEESYLVVAMIGVLVFCIFNFRPKGKAKCFAGDVGSIGIAFIMLFALGKLIVMKVDLSYWIFMVVYGVDGILTIFHRIQLHENLGEAHRKHAYQLMANELKIDHLKISLLYMAVQLAVSLSFIYLCPDTVLAHWIFLICTGLLLSLSYLLFMKKYYHLHEEYLAGLKRG